MLSVGPSRKKTDPIMNPEVLLYSRLILRIQHSDVQPRVHKVCSLNLFSMRITQPNHKPWLRHHNSVLLLLSSPPIPFFFFSDDYFSMPLSWMWLVWVSVLCCDFLAKAELEAKCCGVFWLLWQSLVPFSTSAVIFQNAPSQFWA